MMALGFALAALSVFFVLGLFIRELWLCHVEIELCEAEMKLCEELLAEIRKERERS